MAFPLAWEPFEDSEAGPGLLAWKKNKGKAVRAEESRWLGQWIGVHSSEVGSGGCAVAVM